MPIRSYHPIFEFNNDLKTLDHDRVTEEDWKVVEDAKSRILRHAAIVGGVTYATSFVGLPYIASGLRRARYSAPAFVAFGVAAFAADRKLKNEFNHVRATLPEGSYLGSFLRDVIQPYFTYYYGPKTE